MGGVTSPSGWPYVTPDDFPKEFPAHSQLLANSLEIFSATVRAIPVVNGGWVNLSAIAAGASATVNITFPPGVYPIPPMVFVQPSNNRLATGVSAITTSGCTLSFANYTSAGSGAASACWLAVA